MAKFTVLSVTSYYISLFFKPVYLVTDIKNIRNQFKMLGSKDAPKYTLFKIRNIIQLDFNI